MAKPTTSKMPEPTTAKITNPTTMMHQMAKPTTAKMTNPTTMMHQMAKPTTAKLAEPITMMHHMPKPTTSKMPSDLAPDNMMGYNRPLLDTSIVSSCYAPVNSNNMILKDNAQTTNGIILTGTNSYCQN